MKIKIYSPSIPNINTKQAIFGAFILRFLVIWFVIWTCVRMEDIMEKGAICAVTLKAWHPAHGLGDLLNRNKKIM